MNTLKDASKPLILIILDGWGHGAPGPNNAISQASTPNWDRLYNNCPHTLISGSGLDVGLPKGQMGNSEVGHMTMGAGRVIFQDLTLISHAIDDLSFFQNNVLQKAISSSGTIHILGLLSPGGVHSHEDHIFAMLKMIGNKKVIVHPFLDGRDTPPESAKASLEKLQTIANEHPNIIIADLVGRFYAMDRDNRAERTKAACDLLTKSIAQYSAPDCISALQQAYDRGETDEFVKPTKIHDAPIRDGDSVIFMNFRTDRARQLCYALKENCNIDLVTLTEYDRDLGAEVAFSKQPINNIFSEVIANNNLKQLHVAETEKYAHVTFFFNAGREEAFAGEERVLIPSAKVKTYDLQPEMSAMAITSVVENAIKKKEFDVIICNFANADMVGHTGNLNAAIAAIETLDNCLGKILRSISKYGGQALITADHGNAEVMWNDTSKQAHTAHTTNLIPLVYAGHENIKFLTGNYGLQDIAPTMLKLLKIKIPKEMTGVPLFAN